MNAALGVNQAVLRLSAGKCGGDIYDSNMLINIQMFTHIGL